MSRWYRAYSGIVKDDKLAEIAVMGACSRAVAIATWHAILESAADMQDGGRFDTTPRRVAAVLGEPALVVEQVFAAMRELGMIGDNRVNAWKRRQYESDNSTERSRKHRDAKRNGDATLQGRCATPPDTETEITSEVQELVLIPGETEEVRPKQVRTAYPADFEDFWKAYPTDALMSKKKAAAEWKRLSSDKRAAALASCPAFRAHCSATPDYRPVHACRYLSEERFAGFAATQERVAATANTYIMAGAPGWDEWQAVRRTPTDAKGGWWFPSQFPDDQRRSAA